MALVGSHVVKQWSNTQNVIALPSGEAEYYSMVKGGYVGIGLRSALADMRVAVKVAINTDASAAAGIAPRKGLGKVRDIEVNQLWLQDKVGKGETEVRTLMEAKTLQMLSQSMLKQRR